MRFRDGPTGAIQTAKTDFDPWGVRLNGTGMTNPIQNRFEMQVKEKEMTFGLNHVNFGARSYNPTIGRFLSVDDLSENFYSYSPYNFTLNNPLRYIDPDGNSPVDWFKNQDGVIQWFNTSASGFSDASGNSWSNIGTELLQFNRRINLKIENFISDKAIYYNGTLYLKESYINTRQLPNHQSS